MRSLLRLICLGCLLAALVGCAFSAVEPVPKQTELELPPLPELDRTVGAPVTVNGTKLANRTMLLDGAAYVPLEDVAEILQVSLQPKYLGYSFPWHKQPVVITPGNAAVQVGDRLVPLDAAPVIDGEELLIPLQVLTDGLGFGLLEDQEQLYLTEGAQQFDIPPGYYVPTLMYHGVSDATWGFTELFVSPSDLEAQLQYLQDNGYTTIHFSDLRYIDTIEKPVLLTFDDGYADNYRELFPLLQKYNAKATVFVVTGALDVNPNFMTWAQAKEMADSGLVSIQSHTVSHRDLDSLTLQGQIDELTQSKLDILRHIGRESTVLCYPTGRYNMDTLTAMDGLYDFGVKINGNRYYTEHSPLEINRWYVSRYTELYTFGDMLRP